MRDHDGTEFQGIKAERVHASKEAAGGDPASDDSDWTTKRKQKRSTTSVAKSKVHAAAGGGAQIAKSNRHRGGRPFDSDGEMDVSEEDDEEEESGASGGGSDGGFMDDGNDEREKRPTIGPFSMAPTKTDEHYRGLYEAQFPEEIKGLIRVYKTKDITADDAKAMAEWEAACEANRLGAT